MPTIMSVSPARASPLSSWWGPGASARCRCWCRTRLAAEVFTNGYVLAMRWTMVLPIAVVALAAVSCLLIKQDGGQDRPAVPGPSQMAGTISSPGPSGSAGNSPGSASGTVS
jgi:hypothetical protein